jgi:LysM repeat protein
MKTKMKFMVLACLFALGTGLDGCGTTKRIDSTEIPQSPQSNEPTAVAPVAAVPSARYTVEKGNTLWEISGQSQIYADSFEWPLLFKANRDQIQDPDLIYPRQVLKVEKGISTDDLARAKKLAMDTPKYIPHSKPRETLPIDYF